VVLIAVNVVLLRRGFEPLERLAALMRRIDPLVHGRRIGVERPVAEVADVYRAFNAMLDRLDIARGLRPQALDEFGLRSALVALAAGFADRTGTDVHQRVEPRLAPEQELAVYRVAQESLTNVARHARAGAVELGFGRRDGAVVLSVRDDGEGLSAAEAAGNGVGLGGMRERALLVGGLLAIESPPPGGVSVRLDLPSERGRP
jgi:two-component system, NarL family, sensor histidine kinase UhpB